MNVRLSIGIIAIIVIVAFMGVEANKKAGYQVIKTDYNAPSRYALYMSYASCKLRALPHVERFVMHEANHYYPNLDVKLIGGHPRIKIYDTRADRDNSTIDGNAMSADYIMNLLKLGPDAMPAPPTPVAEFDVKDWTNPEIHMMLQKWRVVRNFPVDVRVWHAKLGIDTQQ